MLTTCLNTKHKHTHSSTSRIQMPWSFAEWMWQKIVNVVMIWFEAYWLLPIELWKVLNLNTYISVSVDWPKPLSHQEVVLHAFHFIVFVLNVNCKLLHLKLNRLVLKRSSAECVFAFVCPSQLSVPWALTLRQLHGGLLCPGGGLSVCACTCVCVSVEADGAVPAPGHPPRCRPVPTGPALGWPTGC